jgi:hypothetical protein
MNENEITDMVDWLNNLPDFEFNILLNEIKEDTQEQLKREKRDNDLIDIDNILKSIESKL